ncbi:hypothetical protein [Streptomyces sp. NPDC051219]|uniref:hypothetical protein n=1 Tax=Streptomyces sp. NPDC051219 TaxID=3155283 RepID=UPI003449E03A
MDTRTGTEPVSSSRSRIAREQRIRTCRSAVAETGRDAPEAARESNPEWNIVRGED